MTRDEAIFVEEASGSEPGEYAVMSCATRFVYAPSLEAAKAFARSVAAEAKDSTATHSTYIFAVPEARLNKALFAAVERARAALKLSNHASRTQAQRTRAARELARCAMALMREESTGAQQGEVLKAAQQAFDAAKAMTRHVAEASR